MPKPARKSASPTPTPSKPRARSDVSAKAGKAKVADKAPALSKTKPKAAPRKPGAAAALTDRQKQFVTEYLKDQNGSAAYQRAGYKSDDESARRAASRLMTNVDVRAAIDAGLSKLRQKTEEETGINLKRVVEEIAKGAFFDPRAMFNEDGSPKAITDLADREASALAGFEVLDQFEGSGPDRVFVGHLKKFKLSERKAYLDMLMKHLGGYEKDNEQKTSPLVELLGIVHGSGSLLPRKAQ